jgi:LacI family transcriptional regulator
VGVLPDARLVAESDFRVEGGFDAAARLLELPDRPTAIFAFNDPLAIGAMQAARSHGLRIPEDVSIVGFDDTIEAQFVTPGLTTVRQPLAEMGRMAVSLLLRLLENQAHETVQLELATRLVVRSSTTRPSQQ